MNNLGVLSIRSAYSIIKAREKIFHLAENLSLNIIESSRLSTICSEVLRRMPLESESCNLHIDLVGDKTHDLHLTFSNLVSAVEIPSNLVDYFDDHKSLVSKKFGFGEVLVKKVQISKQGEAFSESISRLKSIVQSKNREELMHDLRLKNKELNETNAALEKFVPADFLRFLGKGSIRDFKLGDALEKDFTILFSDMRSFSTIAEGFTPSELFSFINRYLSFVVPVIHKYNGFVITYIGDAIMAAFPGGGADALKCSKEIFSAVDEFNIVQREEKLKEVEIGVGVNQGKSMIGIIGDVSRMEPAIMSDVVNLSARLESLSKRYGARTILSEAVIEKMEADSISEFEYRLLDNIRVVGRNQAVTIYELLDYPDCVLDNLKKQQKEAFEKAQAFYYQKKIHKCYEILASLKRNNEEDKAIPIFMDRCAELLVFNSEGQVIGENVPKDWSPIQSLTSKT